MVYIYSAILLILLVAALVCSGYQKTLIRSLDKKEHPVRLFYPLAAKLTDLFSGIRTGGNVSKVDSMLKSLYVKENVAEEHYIYTVKKVATVLTIAAAAALLGALVCFSRIGVEYIRSLERNVPGGGVQNYELQVDYQGTEDVISVPVEEEQYTREEILALFDESIDEIEQELLGDNESADHVDQPLNFLSQYGQIKIFWKIEDPDIVGYNGEIKAELEEEETLVLNLFATLSIGEVSKTYGVPVVITAPKLSEKEILVKRILESIEENNDVYEKEVQLPESIDGKQISFKKAQENHDAVILIISLLAVIVIAAGYDQRLENKVKKRKEQMMIDFTEIVSKLSLMYEAGSSILKAWEKIVADQEQKGEVRFAYQEMKLALEKIKSGVRERDAYAQFGKRCGLHPYMKLGNILEQNLSKGTKGLKLLLKQETEDAFEERKRLARKKGEEAGTKMLVPMVLMMVVVIVIIAVPALMSINL